MRLPKIRTVAFLIKIARENYFLTPQLDRLRAHFAKAGSAHRLSGAPTVLIQCVEDYFYFALFGKIAAGLRACGSIRVDQYCPRSLRQNSSLSLRQFFWNSIGQNWLSDWKWRRLYGAFTDRAVYRATGWVFPWTALRLWWTAWRLWRGLRNVDELAQLRVMDIWIGDLVIDSYIRFKPAPTPAVNDPYLLIVIRQALKDIYKADQYFRRNRPAMLLTSYTTYIQHGVAARVAVRRGIPVRAFSNLQDFATEITCNDVWHTRDGKAYKKDFFMLPDQAGKIASAEKQLNNRMAGRIDAATSYMKASAYGRTDGAEFDVKGMPVIFLHDFYDSVHVYRWITFHDFWTWVCFTIDTLQAAEIPFAIKPHPNQVTGSSDIIDRLLAKYPNLILVPSGVANDQLAKGGMACAITVYGTVASEMAFMGIPTVSCGDNPHISFDFCRTARTSEEYAKLLLDCRSLPAVPIEMHRESCIFYYMHNLHLAPEEEQLKDKMTELRRRIFFVESTPSPQEIIDAASEFASGPALQAFCASLYGLIRDRAGQAGEDTVNRA